MSGLPDALTELQRFIKVGLGLVTLEIEPDPESEILPFLPPAPEPLSSDTPLTSFNVAPQTRAQAYKMIGDIGDFLQTVEPHSPAPALLKRIATWGD